MNIDGVWMPVPGYEGIYEVRSGADGGRVRRIANGKEQCGVKREGYLRVRLYRNGEWEVFPLHRLILTVFMGPPKPGEIGRHLDDNKANNSIDNLAWGTLADNAADSTRNGTFARGERSGRAKGTNEAVRQAREKYAAGGISIKELAEEYGIEHTAMRMWVIGKFHPQAGGPIAIRPRGQNTSSCYFPEAISHQEET